MKKLLVLLTLILALSTVLAACGTNEEASSTTDATTGATVDETNTEDANTEKAATEVAELSKVKMIQLGTKNAMRFAEFYNVADEAGFDKWYNDVFANEEYYADLKEVSPNGSTKLLGVSVGNVEVEAVDANSFNFSVELTYEVLDNDTEETTTFTEALQATIVNVEGSVYAIQTLEVTGIE